MVLAPPSAVSHEDGLELYINGLVQERRNSSTLAMELRLSCINTEILLCPLDMISAGSADGRMHKCMQSLADAAQNLCLHVELCKKMPW